MKALVVGLGSIGRRHRRVLSQLGWEVLAVSRHAGEEESTFPEARAAFDHGAPFDLVIVASETFRHERDVLELWELGHRGRWLVEKPLGFRASFSSDFDPKLIVGFNLRCHPVVHRLKEYLHRHHCYHASLEVRSHLPTMRGPDVDYRRCYSCFRDRGGGVLRDYSHDLDLALNLFGSCRQWKAMGGKLGPLHGDAMDSVAMVGHHENCPLVNIQMSYLDTRPCRRITLVTEAGTVHADLSTGEMILPTGEVFPPDPEALARTYEQQIVDVMEDAPHLCGLEEAMRVEEWTEKLETALLG